MTLEQLNRDLPRLKQRFASAKPFPHVVIDNFLDQELAEQIVEAFPTPEEMRTHGGDPTVLKGWQLSPKDKNYIPKPPLESMFRFLQSKGVRHWLTELSGAETEVVCDPEYVGAGLLLARDKGIHKIHLDRNRHPNEMFCARLVLLIYFNKAWSPAHGGALELWNRRITKCTTVEPLFNRCVIFENSRFSYHSISDVHMPPGMTRKALNFYYFSRDLPKVERNMYIHDTEFFPRPNEKAAWWRNKLRTKFPIGIVSALLQQSLPTAKLYHSVKRKFHRTGADGESVNPKAVEQAWEEYNASQD